MARQTKETVQSFPNQYLPPDAVRELIPGFKFKTNTGRLKEGQNISGELFSNASVEWFINPDHEEAGNRAVVAASRLTMPYENGKKTIQLIAMSQNNFDINARKHLLERKEEINQHDLYLNSHSGDLFTVAINHGEDTKGEGSYNLTSTVRFGLVRARFHHNPSSMHWPTSPKIIEALRENGVPLVAPHSTSGLGGSNDTIKLSFKENILFENWSFVLLPDKSRVRVDRVDIPSAPVSLTPSWSGQTVDCIIPGYACSSGHSPRETSYVETQKEDVYEFNQTHADTNIGFPAKLPQYLEKV